MFSFGMNPSAQVIIFHISWNKYIFRKHEEPSFVDDVVDFLSTKSLMHTIVDIDFTRIDGYNTYDVYMQPSCYTNIDSDLIGSVIRNINAGLTH